jgi:hypothetical protein
MQQQSHFHYEVVMWALGVSTGDVFKFLSHRESLGRVKNHVETFVYMALNQFAVFIFNENDNSNFDQILQLTKDKENSNISKKKKKNKKKEDIVNKKDKDKDNDHISITDSLKLSSDQFNVSISINSNYADSPYSLNEVISTKQCNLISITDSEKDLNHQLNQNSPINLIKDANLD